MNLIAGMGIQVSLRDDGPIPSRKPDKNSAKDLPHGGRAMKKWGGMHM